MEIDRGLKSAWAEREQNRLEVLQYLFIKWVCFSPGGQNPQRVRDLNWSLQILLEGQGPSVVEEEK